MMNYYRPALLLTFWGILILNNPTVLQGQDTLTLSLDDVIALVQEQSPQMRSAKLDLIASEWEYKAFQASLKPQIGLDANLPGFSRSISEISQDDGSALFRTQSRAFSRASLRINQQLPLTGGTVFITSSLSSLFNFEPIDTRLWQTSPLVIGVIQPLFQINTIKWNQREEQLRYRLSQISYLASLEDLSNNITQIYFDALTAQTNRDRAQLNVANNDTIYRISEGRYSVEPDVCQIRTGAGSPGL